MSHNDMYFRVAGLLFRTVFLDETDARPLLNSYAPFHKKAPIAPPTLTITFGKGLVDPEAEGEEVGQFDAGGCNHGVYRRDEGGYKIIISDVTGEQVCAMVIDATGCEVQATPLVEDFSQKRFGINNAIMISYASAGARCGVLLVHSSVVMVDGKGYMFLGTSGTGKSTHSDLWVKHIPGAEILNDDNPAIALTEEGAPLVYGTPWSGKRDFYRPLRLPIGGIVRLEQAKENHIHREQPLYAFASVLSSCSTMIWDKENYDGVCRAAERVAMSVPVFHLKNRPEEAAARMSYEAATKAQETPEN